MRTRHQHAAPALPPLQHSLGVGQRLGGGDAKQPLCLLQPVQADRQAEQRVCSCGRRGWDGVMGGTLLGGLDAMSRFASWQAQQASTLQSQLLTPEGPPGCRLAGCMP